MSLQVATSLLEKADAQERMRCFASALSLYEKGIAELIQILKAHPDDERIRDHVKAFLEKAEKCKLRISSTKPAVPPRRPTCSSAHRSDVPGRSGLHRTITKHETIKSTSKYPVPKKSSSESDIKSSIESEILDKSPNVSVTDIIGLEQLKSALYEAIVLPRIQPEIFSGLRKPPKAILLFGPPGNGKTMIAKAIATESTCTFFSISSSSLTSKWLGQGEKLVRALFESAAENQPSVIFIDEIDSILSARSSTSEHEASRRLKTEFLVRFDGVTSSDTDNILLIAATNLPHELDEAVLRRFTRRFHIGQPNYEARRRLIQLLLDKNKHVHSLTRSEMDQLVKVTEGYSSSDLTELCKEAAMWPIRDLGPIKIQQRAKISSVPSISYEHFKKALLAVKKSVCAETVQELLEWDRKYGTDLSTVKSFSNTCKPS